MEAASVPAEPGGEPQQEQQQGPDLTQFGERLDQMAQGWEEFGERFSKIEQALTPPPEPDPYGGIDPALLEPGEQGIDPQQFMQAMQELADKRAAEAIGPVQQQLAEMKRDVGARDLEARYPALQDPKNAQAAMDAAQQYAQAFGQPGLALEPRFIEMAWLAQSGTQLAQSEVPAGGQQGAPMERAGGAGPTQQEEPSITDRLRGVKDSGLNSFWT
jgi:hypothetical protein